MDASRLSREDAASEAIRLASELVAGRDLPLIGAGPATRLLAEQLGTPSQWRVLFENRSSDGTAFEGAIGVMVDLEQESAEFDTVRA